MGSTASGRGVLLALCLFSGTAWAEAGDVSGTFAVGTSLVAQRFATSTKSAELSTIGDNFSPSEFVGAGYFLTDRLRLGLNLQFTEAVAVPNPQPPSAWTVFSLLPQVSYRFYWDLYAALVGFFPLRYGGVWQAGYGIQLVLGAAIPVAKIVAVTVAVEVPYLAYPVEALGLTPLVGVSVKL